MKTARKWMALFIAISLVVSLAGFAAAADKAKPKKININKAGVKELQGLMWTADEPISEEQAKQIIKFRKKHGPFENGEDIKDVPGGFGIIFYIDNKDIITIK